MTTMVEVWNDNDLEYSEMFNGDLIKIPANSCITMERENAVIFLGTMGVVLSKTSQGEPDKKSFKMLRTAPVRGDIIQEENIDTGKVEISHKCMKCGISFDSKLSLDEHLKTHKGEVITDIEAEKRLAELRRPKKSELETSPKK